MSVSIIGEPTVCAEHGVTLTHHEDTRGLCAVCLYDALNRRVFDQHPLRIRLAAAERVVAAAREYVAEEARFGDAIAEVRALRAEIAQRDATERSLVDEVDRLDEQIEQYRAVVAAARAYRECWIELARASPQSDLAVYHDVLDRCVQTGAALDAALAATEVTDGDE